MNAINEIIEQFPNLLCMMVSMENIKTILTNLDKTIHLEGDIVELGCFVGTTTLYIQRYLDKIGSNKNIHVYDSFEGLPEPCDFDKHNLEQCDNYSYKKGDLQIDKDIIASEFWYNGLKMPIINKGFFSEIPDEKYPEKICFAFFDGDLYNSIIDSFNKVYNKVVPGGKILIHDFNLAYVKTYLPGVRKACEDFLMDKPEYIEQVEQHVAIITKQ